MKDKALAFGWIFGILILISVLLIVTQPVQERYLSRTINRVLAVSGENIIIIPALPRKNSDFLGFRYSIVNSSDGFYVFAVFKDGVLLPMGARFADNGKIINVIPLGFHAGRMYDSIPPAIMQMYISRIELSLSKENFGRKR
jgi:hypothetical protein